MPSNSKTTLKQIVDFSRKKGFVYPSSEIYGGFAATYDFGPLGILLKKNIENLWRFWNVTSRTDVVEIEGAIFMHPKTWEASGHIGGFSDLMVEDTVTKKRYRADHLIEDAKVVWPAKTVNSEQLTMNNDKSLSEEDINKLEAKAKEEGYELAVDCFVTNEKGEVFAQKRSSSRRLYPENWDLPGGHVDLQDSLYKTIFKEVKEETNLEVDKILYLFNTVQWQVPSEALRESENASKIIFQFVVTVKSLDEIKLEEGKADEWKWINLENVEILKENCKDNSDFYTYESVKKFLEKNTQSALRPATALVEENFVTNAGSFSAEEVDEIISYYNLKSPDGNALSKAKKFNLLVQTHLGPVEDETSVAYLKGESCANIYLDWKAVQETTRKKLPFGIAQIGKAFRNEITVKQFMFRTREFEQMDVEYFVKPGTENDFYKDWKDNRWNFYTEALKFKTENLNYRQHDKDELVFYAKEAWDVEYNFGELGFKELEGVHNRTSYDTDQHSKFSGQDLSYFDPETNTRYNPYIVEMSAGFNRMFLATLFEFYNEEVIQESQETRVVLKFPLELAPFKLAILPLMKKDGLGQKAFEIFSNLRKKGISCDYDEAGSVGKRYRRQDENGTPFCITLDYQTLEDNTVTVRDRDTMEQKRIKIEEIESLLK